MFAVKLGRWFWVTAVALIVILVSFAVVLPQSRTARTLAFGDWTSAVKISNEEMMWGDVSAFGLYKYGWNNMTYTSDWGTSWMLEKPMGGMVEVVGDTIYRVNSSSVFTGLWFCKSIDNGTTWSTPINLGLSAGNDGYFGIQMLNGTLFVHNYNGTSEMALVLVKSVDLGATWSAPITIANFEWTDPIPNEMVFFEQKLYLVYWKQVYLVVPPFIRYDVVLTSSSDMGDTWGNEVVLDVGCMPLIKVDSGQMYVTYLNYSSDFMDWRIEFVRSSDGVEWTSPIVVGPFTDVTDPSNQHSLSVSSGRIAVAYLDYKMGSPDKYVVRVNYSSDDGVTWQDLGDVTGRTTNAMMPTVYIVNDTLHFFWVDMGTEDGTGGPYPTYYRAMDLTGGPVIPEFGMLTVPVMGALAILVLVGRRWRRTE